MKRRQNPGQISPRHVLFREPFPKIRKKTVTLPKLNKPMKNRFDTYRFCSVLKSKIALISCSRLPSRQVVWNAGL